MPHIQCPSALLLFFHCTCSHLASICRRYSPTFHTNAICVILTETGRELGPVGGTRFELHLEFTAARFPSLASRSDWTWRAALANTTHCVSVSSRLTVISTHRLTAEHDALCDIQRAYASASGAKGQVICLNGISVKLCFFHMQRFENPSTNIYNFIDSLLVQDVHSYFVNSKGENKPYDDSWLGMLAYEMIIILMGTTNSMEYCSVQPSLKCL